MKIKASAAAALMLAAGLCVAFAGPSPATAAGSDSAAATKSESATSGKSVRHGSRYWKKKRYAYRKYAQTASKSAETGKAAGKDVAGASANVQPALPEWVANANAQMTSADPAQDSARAMSVAMSAKANTILLAAADKSADVQAPADGAVTAPDQLNDLDRALQQAPSTQTVAMAQATPAQEAPVLASNNDSLDRTSLIGKIFIAFGTLLTMASAARMLMA